MSHSSLHSIPTLGDGDLNQSRPGMAWLALLLLVPAPSIGVVLAMVLDSTQGTAFGQAAWAFSKAWILVFPLTWMVLVERWRPARSPIDWRSLRTGLISGAAIMLAILWGYWFVGRDIVDVRQVRAMAEKNGFLEPWKYLVLAGYLSIVNSLLEEYVWRWFVQRQCAAIVGGPLSVLASALLFTIHHVIALKAQMGWSATLLGSLGVFIGGFMWGWCYWRYKSIWPGWMSHILADIGVFAVAWHILFRA